MRRRKFKFTAIQMKISISSNQYIFQDFYKHIVDMFMFNHSKPERNDRNDLAILSKVFILILNLYDIV